MEAWDLRKTGWLAFFLVLAAGAALYWAALAQQPRGADADQIRTLLVKGERAVEERDLSEAMALVSKEYKDDHGLRYGSLRVLAMRRLQEAQSIDVNLPSRLIQVEVDPDGKHATAHVRADVRVADRFNSVSDMSANLTLRLAKEPVRYYGVFPGEEWRVVKIEGWQGMAE